jgi:hypothetical protein
MTQVLPMHVVSGFEHMPERRPAHHPLLTPCGQPVRKVRPAADSSETLRGPRGRRLSDDSMMLARFAAWPAVRSALASADPGKSGFPEAPAPEKTVIVLIPLLGEEATKALYIRFNHSFNSHASHPYGRLTGACFKSGLLKHAPVPVPWPENL